MSIEYKSLKTTFSLKVSTPHMVMFAHKLKIISWMWMSYICDVV